MCSSAATASSMRPLLNFQLARRQISGGQSGYQLAARSRSSSTDSPESNSPRICRTRIESSSSATGGSGGGRSGAENGLVDPLPETLQLWVIVKVPAHRGRWCVGYSVTSWAFRTREREGYGMEADSYCPRAYGWIDLRGKPSRCWWILAAANQPQYQCRARAISISPPRLRLSPKLTGVLGGIRNICAAFPQSDQVGFKKLFFQSSEACFPRK